MLSRFIAVLALAGTLPAFGAQDRDPLNSSECKAARAELEQAVNEAAPGSHRSARLALARKHAASACLGRQESRAAPACCRAGS